MARRMGPRGWLMPLCLTLLLGGLTLPAPAVGAATTRHVTDCGDAGANTLRGQIAAAAGDTIVFDQNCTITLATGTVQLSKDVTIDGTGHSVIVDGGCTGCDPAGTPSGGVTVFLVFPDTTVSLNNLTIRHGGGFLSGGGLAGNAGGGITNSGKLTVTNSTITANYTVDDGGGIKNTGFGTLSVTDSAITANQAHGHGGGIESLGTPLILTHDTITGNTAHQGGGGVHVYEVGTVTSSTITGNTAGGPIPGGGTYAGAGGGLYSVGGGAVTVADSTVSNNSASLGGGGIYRAANGATALALANCTLAGNASGAAGGGIASVGIVSVTNSTLSGNSTPPATGDGGGGIWNWGTLTVTSSTLAGQHRAGERWHLQQRYLVGVGQHALRQRRER